MLYLAIQFAWFLLAALALGFVMGWISCPRGGFRAWAGPLPFVVALWVLVAGLTWLQIVNGFAALWLETALLYVVAYLAGCAAGSVLRLSLPERTGLVPSAVAVPESPPLLPPASPAAAAGSAAPPVSAERAAEAEHPGTRPAGLEAARAATPDDLKLIKGIGKQNEARLHSLGIWHFDQIATWTPENVAWVGSYLAFPGRIERENWVAQARVLAGAK